MMTALILALMVTLAAIAWSDRAHAQNQPTVSDIATCNNEAEATAGSPSALPRPTPAPAPKPDPGTATDSTGQLLRHTDDPRLEGMAAARVDDAAFRAAYRACMQRLGY